MVCPGDVYRIRFKAVSRGGTNHATGFVWTPPSDGMVQVWLKGRYEERFSPPLVTIPLARLSERIEINWDYRRTYGITDEEDEKEENRNPHRDQLEERRRQVGERLLQAFAVMRG